jgi:NADP-dependent 3-hydroxy acid dehydrogenase YdfG
MTESKPQTVFVTGAGFGAAIARHFAATGCRVVAVAFAQDRRAGRRTW